MVICDCFNLIYIFVDSIVLDFEISLTVMCVGVLVFIYMGLDDVSS